MNKAQKAALKKAGKKVAKGVRKHFNTKSDGWPLDYSLLIQDTFYEAFNHHVEDYLFPLLYKSGLLLFIRDGTTVIGTKAQAKAAFKPAVDAMRKKIKRANKRGGGKP